MAHICCTCTRERTLDARAYTCAVLIVSLSCSVEIHMCLFISSWYISFDIVYVYFSLCIYIHIYT